MAFELWDAETGNILGSYVTERAAALEIRQTVQDLGSAAVEHLALACEDEAGETTPIAAGLSLISWAETELAPTAPVAIGGHRRIA